MKEYNIKELDPQRIAITREASQDLSTKFLISIFVFFFIIVITFFLFQLYHGGIMFFIFCLQFYWVLFNYNYLNEQTVIIDKKNKSVIFDNEKERKFPNNSILWSTREINYDSETVSYDWNIYIGTNKYKIHLINYSAKNYSDQSINALVMDLHQITGLNYVQQKSQKGIQLQWSDLQSEKVTGENNNEEQKRLEFPNIDSKNFEVNVEDDSTRLQYTQIVDEKIFNKYYFWVITGTLWLATLVHFIFRRVDIFNILVPVVIGIIGIYILRRLIINATTDMILVLNNHEFKKLQPQALFVKEISVKLSAIKEYTIYERDSEIEVEFVEEKERNFSLKQPNSTNIAYYLINLFDYYLQPAKEFKQTTMEENI